MPLFMVAGLGVIVALLIATRIQPITKHLLVQLDRSPYAHLLGTMSKRNYRIGFLATALLSVGGFMMMPFGTTFATNNLHIADTDLFKLMMVSGISSLIIMPLIGKFADKIDKFVLFTIASVWMMVVVVLYTNLGITPL